uniref:Uncharacterized protein n=1 Tax=Arundo donax TaxID=35708 RepID=A0A0A9FLT1_ARUDO
MRLPECLTSFFKDLVSSTTFLQAAGRMILSTSRAMDRQPFSHLK